jgi:hypothetical protein
MKTDTETILNVFGKNEQFRKVSWAVFIALAGLVLTQVVDPATAQEILQLLTGRGRMKILIPFFFASDEKMDTSQCVNY